MTNTLGGTRQTSLIVAVVSGTLPLVLLQGATTQNDLMAAAFALSAVYFIYKLVEQKSIIDAVCLGMCVGGTFLSKISAGAVLVPFGIAYLICKLRQKELRTILLNAVGCLIITAPYWYRNAVDNAGDFLALHASNYLNMGKTFSLADHIGGIIIAIGYCGAGYIKFFNARWLGFLRLLYHGIGAKEYGNWDCFEVAHRPNHDFYPYGIAFTVGVMCTILIIARKRYTNKQKLYCFLSTVALILNAAIMPLFFAQSVTRYMMAAILLIMIPIAIVIDKIESGIANNIVCVLLGIIILINGTWTNLYDTASPLIGIFDQTYEEKRDLLTPRSMSWSLKCKEVKDEIDTMGAYDIGIWEKEQTHIYSMLHELMNQKYDVRSIEGEYARDYTENFNPDVIIYVDKELTESISYNNKRYKLRKEIDFVFINKSKAALYAEQ